MQSSEEKCSRRMPPFLQQQGSASAGRRNLAPRRGAATRVPPAPSMRMPRQRRPRPAGRPHTEAGNAHSELRGKGRAGGQASDDLRLGPGPLAARRRGRAAAVLQAGRGAQTGWAGALSAWQQCARDGSLRQCCNASAVLCQLCPPHRSQRQLQLDGLAFSPAHHKIIVCVRLDLNRAEESRDRASSRLVGTLLARRRQRPARCSRPSRGTRRPPCLP